MRVNLDAGSGNCSGGPYITWQGTAYAHVMIPVRDGASPMAAGAMN